MAMNGGEDEFLAALGRCVAPAAEAFSLPPACYHDASLSEIEVASLFRGRWLPVGRADIVKKPGDYTTLEIAGVSLILLRDKAGELRAFANSCRHRGARLLSGDGSTDLIRCPFHCWTYRLSGELVGGSHMEATANFRTADFGLVPFRAAERAGFVFICFDDEAGDLDRQLGDFETLHAPWPLGDLVTTRRRELEVACNWKAFLEVFNEYYHLPYVHPDSLNDIYNLPDPADRVTGSYASQFGSTDGTGGLLESQQEHALPTMPGLTGRAALGTRYTWLFPNLTFAAGQDAVWIYEAYPLESARCRVVQTICFPRKTVVDADFESKATQYYHRLDAALDEDLPALVNQQQGLTSPFAKQGRFSVSMEPNVAAFAAWYAQCMLEAVQPRN